MFQGGMGSVVIPKGQDNRAPSQSWGLGLNPNLIHSSWNQPWADKQDACHGKINSRSHGRQEWDWQHLASLWLKHTEQEYSGSMPHRALGPAQGMPPPVDFTVPSRDHSSHFFNEATWPPSSLSKVRIPWPGKDRVAADTYMWQ